MRAGVAKIFLALGAVKGENFNLTVLLKRSAQIDLLSVDLAAAGCLIKPRTETFCNFKDSCAVFKFLNDAAFECNINHGFTSFHKQSENKKASPTA